jgi:formylglycine-generating enzyme required for sulfatase activity
MMIVHYFTATVLVLVATLHTAVTSPTFSISQLRDELYALADSLRWNNGTHTTYAPVHRAAVKAQSTLISVARDKPNAVPRAVEFSETIARLTAESHYLVALSASKNYEQGFMDSTMFLTGSVDEWRFTIVSMINKLEEPSGYCNPQPGRSAAVGISRDTTPKTEFRDHDLAPWMIVIPTGCYTAGSTEQEMEFWGVPPDTRDFELPRRKVCIPTPLAFSQNEITVAQFDTFVRSTGYEIRGGARWFNLAVSSRMVFNPDLNYTNPGFHQTLDSPVVCIRWQDAKAYADWLSVITGATYRLPTEDEWEWAARGGSNDTFFWGNDLEHANLYANTYDFTAKQATNFSWPPVPLTDGFPFTSPVGTFYPNGFGLYDVTGNAREFVADSWVQNLDKAANDGSAHVGPVPFRVVRGGAWNYKQRNYRINYRDGYFSSEVATYMFGFRLVREL